MTSGRYVVTGAHGYIGSRVTQHLRDQGEALAVDQFWGHAPPVPEPRISVDLAQPLPDAPELTGTTIVHAAGLVNVEDRRMAWDANVTASFNVLDWAVRHRAEHVILFSTAEVYAYRSGHRYRESDPVSPLGIFGHSKQLCERIGAAFTRLYGLPVSTARLFFPFGGGQSHGHIAALARAVRCGTAIQAYRDGGPTINPVHVDDVVRAIAQIAESPEGYRVFNVCGDEEIARCELIELFERRYGAEAVLDPMERDCGDLLGDNSLLKQQFGWRPQVGLSALETAAFE